MSADATAVRIIASADISVATRRLFNLSAPSWRATRAARPCPDLILVRHCNWEGAAKLSHPRTEAGSGYIRIGFDGDRLWIGPNFSADSEGCERCFQTRLRSNHPQRDAWPDLFGREEVGRAADFPLAPPLMQIIWTLAQRVAEEEIEQKYYFLLDCTTARVDRHMFFPNPECEHCSILPDDSSQLAQLTFARRPKTNRRQFRLDNPALDARSIERAFVDRRTGLVKHIFQDTNSQLVPMVAAEAVLFKNLAPTIGYGRAPTLGQSRMVAILETAERFASTRPRGKRSVTRAARSNLGDMAIDPRLFTLHTEEQLSEPGFSLMPYDDELEQNWVWAYSWRRRAPILMPEQIAYYGLADAPRLPVNRYVHETSSGCALGGSLEEATLYGLFELIERDAYMTGWYGEFPYPPLDCALAEDRSICAMIARAQAEGYGIHLFDMTLEFGIPSIWAMIEDAREGAPVRSYCASATHIDPERAIASALVEVITSMSVYRKSMPTLLNRARLLLADPSLVQGMEDHVLLFSQPETFEWLGFLPRFERPIPIRERFAKWYEGEPVPDLLAELEKAMERVLSVAHDVLIVDQGFTGLGPLGLQAVRVSAPGLSPVTFGQQFRRIAIGRINRAAAFLGLGRRFSSANINLKPHNFP